MNKSNNWHQDEAMHRAAIEGNLREIEHLMHSGYSMQAFDDLGFTPLHYAVKNEHYQVVKFLLENGADVNAHHEATNSNTSIAVAAEGDYPEIVELLLAFGADPRIQGWLDGT